MPKKANLQERGQEMNTAIDTRTVKISEATLITRAFKRRDLYFCGGPGIGKP